ncbi:ABC transporter related protein [Desulfovibrio sp. X2]|uniref:ABC transporter ATP-binding protein n=1 Tax=Desulfovibrio sp. X2 TaxID=941449 RepID=UPI00035878F1|nr:ABC transporter ATP-binding protein [Desulfovibrio sp. X2]EPR44707.1 ABC transporter related protein [Desulfovibrio sp. X2]
MDTTASPGPILALEHVRFAHPGKPPVFDDVSLAFAGGAFVVVRGPSGAGKSTLLRLLCRMEEPQAGQLLFHGRPYSFVPPSELRRRVALIQQSPQVLPASVAANLRLPFSLKANHGLRAPSDEELSAWLARFLLAGVSLSDEAAGLSVGQRQRLCLIRSLLLDPDVLLLDEPTSALDPESAALVMAEAARLNGEEGRTVILVSHTENLVLPPAARVLRVDRGASWENGETGEGGGHAR